MIAPDDMIGLSPFAAPSKEVFDLKSKTEAQKVRTCECLTCVRSRRWNDIVERNKPNEELLGMINEIRNDLCSAEEDLSIKDCILSGNWPGADRWAQDILTNYEKFKNNS